MRTATVLFLLMFLLLTACSQVEDAADQPVEVDSPEEADANSEEIVDGIGEISEDLQDLEDLVN